jgi:hypothetical protein
MAQISTSLSVVELDSAINWRFSLENLWAANDRITGFMAAIELPNIYRRSENEIHTASDGQKFEVRADSLNANHSLNILAKVTASAPTPSLMGAICSGTPWCSARRNARAHKSLMISCVCGNSARTLPCGGRSVMGVPTAIRYLTAALTTRDRVSHPVTSPIGVTEV